jgi:hypothetical protein
VGKMTEDVPMEIRGRIPNGVVVLEGELPLPEGTTVTDSRRAGLAVLHRPPGPP